MSVFPSKLGWFGQTASSYQVPYSCRFNSPDSAYLTRTPGGAGNRRLFSASIWFKLCNNTSEQFLISTRTGTPVDDLKIDTNGNINYFARNGGSTTIAQVVSTAKLRDFAAWYHLLFVWDSDNATSADRVRFYLNGVRVTSFGTATYPTINTDSVLLNTATAHTIGKEASAANYSDFYLSQYLFKNASALATTDVGEFDTNGVWRPINVTGVTRGTNGFMLDFSNSSALGEDQGSGTNDFTSSGLATNDQKADTPTNNVATGNPLSKYAGTLSDGNLTWTASGGGYAEPVNTSIALPATGFFYGEMELVSTGLGLGFARVTDPAATAPNGSTSTYIGQTANSWGYYCGTGNKNNNGTGAAYGPSSTAGDILMWCCNNGKLYIGKNGTWMNSGDPIAGTGFMYSGITGDLVVQYAMDVSRVCKIRNLPELFTYTPPVGSKALNTANLPTPTIKDGSAHFQTSLWSGSSSAPRTIAQPGHSTFQPDFMWYYRRNGTNFQLITDVVRGFTKTLIPYATSAEATISNLAVTSSGFTFSNNDYNTTGETYAAYQAKAGGAGVSNTNGSITSTVSANPTAGFSVVKWTGTGSNGTVGHGLPSDPKLILVKKTSATEDWAVYHSSLVAGNILFLDLTNASTSGATTFNSTAPTSTVFSVGTGSASNSNGATYVAYCFAEVDGYCKIGSYAGNASADGPYIYTGFAPALLLVKRTDAAFDWVLQDSAREPNNPNEHDLLPDSSAAEDQINTPFDFLSNGFKLRGTSAYLNASGGAYAYLAIAANPFGGLNATPATAR